MLTLNQKGKFVLPAKKVRLTGHEFTQDLSKLLTFTNEKIELWSPNKNKKLIELSQEAITNDASFDPSSKYFATASADGFIRVYETLSGKLLFSIGND